MASAGVDSPLYLGATESGEIELSMELEPNGEYFWRVDVVGYESIGRGGVSSFQIAPLEIEPRALELANPVGVPMDEFELKLSAAEETSWKASTQQPWIKLLAESGTTPDSLRIEIDPSELTTGEDHLGSIQVVADGRSFEVPVSFHKAWIEVLDMVADRERPLLYVVTGTTHQSYRHRTAFLIMVDAETEELVRAVPIGTGANSGLLVHYPENRIYVTNSSLGATVVLDRDTLEPVGEVGFGVGSAAAGAVGRLATVGGSDSARVHLIDSFNDETLSTSFYDGYPFYWDLKKGYGVFDPSGETLYYGESASGDLLKFSTAADKIVATALEEGTEDSRGGLGLLRNEDGSRYFWGGRMFDSELNPLWNFTNLTASTWGNYAKQIDAAGDLLFTSDNLDVIRVFDVKNRKFLFPLHQARNSQVAYSIPTGKFFDSVDFKGTVMKPVVEPREAPPGVVWASGGSAPWLPAEEDGMMVSSPTEIHNRGSRCVVHVPSAATIRFQWRTEIPAGTSGRFYFQLGDQWNGYMSASSEWQDAVYEIPAGGGYFTWYSDSARNGSGESMRCFVRDISILRSRSVLPPSRGQIVSAPDEAADEDADGVSDLLEWAAGSDATNAAVHPTIRSFVVGDEMVFQFDRRLGMRGAALHAEVSADLGAWRELGYPEVRQVDVDGAFETLELRMPLDGPDRFVRLKAITTP